MTFDDIRQYAQRLLGLLPIERFRNPPPTVGVLRFDGVIGRSAGLSKEGITLSSYERSIAKLFSNKRIKAVVIQINSPGGSPVQSALLAQRIRDMADEKAMQVITFCEDVAASGGYWLACAGDEIFADANSIVGSIGVISAGFGFGDLIDRLGIERRVYSTGSRKGMLDPFQDENPEDVDRLKELHQEIFENFKNMVRNRRGDRLLASDDTLFSGDIWTGNQAVEVGLIDGLAEMRSETRKRFGDNVRFQRVNIRQGLLARLRGGGRAGPNATDIVAALDEWALWKRYGV